MSYLDALRRATAAAAAPASSDEAESAQSPSQLQQLASLHPSRVVVVAMTKKQREQQDEEQKKQLRKQQQQHPGDDGDDGGGGNPDASSLDRGKLKRRRERYLHDDRERATGAAQYNNGRSGSCIKAIRVGNSQHSPYCRCCRHAYSNSLWKKHEPKETARDAMKARGGAK